MAITLDLEVRIGRPADLVFAHLIDVERWPEWLIASGIVRVERLDPGALGEGTRLRIDQRVAGRASTLDAHVSAFSASTTFGVTGQDADGIGIDINAGLTADGPVTTLGWHLRIGLPLRYRMLGSMAAPQVRRAAALDLEAFRQRLESVAGA